VWLRTVARWEETALELTTDPDLRRLIERNFEDEQRHITGLATQRAPRKARNRWPAPRTELRVRWPLVAGRLDPAGPCVGAVRACNLLLAPACLTTFEPRFWGAID
jgi:hypothetical protein